jgi:hypothetical protein
VHDVFGTVVWIVCIFAALAAIASLVLNRKTWEEYGKNRLTSDRELDGTAKQGSAAALLERDTEIRQLLEARNARRARRGEPPIDVEEELKRLTAPHIDAELREEIRTLVIARNHRRQRKGEPPLDVEAEIEREIAGLSGI